MSGTVSGKYYGSATRTLTQGATTELAVDTQGRLLTSTSGGSSGGQYNVTPPTLVDGAATVLQTDVNGNLKVVEQYAPVAEDNTNGVIAGAWKPIATNAYTPTLASTLGAGTLVGKASPGNVFTITATNRNAAIRYLQLHNLTAAPGGGAVPLMSWPVDTASATVEGNLVIGAEFFTRAGFFCSVGIALAMSTTSATYTAATAGEHDIACMVK